MTVGRGTVFLVLCVLLSAAAAFAEPSRRVHLTLIGDSVAAEVAYTPQARTILRRRTLVNFQAVACRRLDYLGCSVGGGPPPLDAVDLIRRMGAKLGPVVVMAVGYNDDSIRYRVGLPAALQALREAGVRHVYWLTLRASHTDDLAINDLIRAAARTRPWLTIIDWNRYSRSHPDWFAPDGTHLTPTGATQMATLIATKVNRPARVPSHPS